MRTTAMCFSLLQFPRHRSHTFTNSWWKSFYIYNRNCEGSSPLNALASGKKGFKGGYSGSWSRRSLSTKSDKTSRDDLSSKTTIRHETLDETASSRISIQKSEITDIRSIHHFDIQQIISEKKDLSKFVTSVVFDIETTGFCRVNERIIDIALRDLQGGKNSTFQTLVNPGRYVTNTNVHGISTHMVNRPDVPRMEELIPILLQYVKSRQKPGGFVLWIAHSGRSFDVPFLKNEFNRCSFEIPSNWLFLDTLPLARELMKSGGSKAPPKMALQELRKHYGIPLMGSAHRALSDVHVLALVFQRLTIDLELNLNTLVEKYSFGPSDLVSSKKKKS